MVIFAAGNAISAATRIFEMNRSKPKLYWLHSFIWVLGNGFGGGFASPLLIGRPSIPLTNDTIVPIVIVAWYCTHYLGMQDYLMYTPVRVCWTVFLALFRTHSSCNMVDTANAAIAAGIYYPTAMVGPIFSGTAVGKDN